MKMSILLRKVNHIRLHWYEQSRMKVVHEKILLNYLHRATSLLTFEIEINSACNRTCPWCPNSTNTRPTDKFLDEKLFYKIIDEGRAMSFKGKVAFHLYNEPLLDHRLLTFIAYARERLPLSYLYLNTNGDLFTDEEWRKMRQAGLDYINIAQYDGKINAHIQAFLDRLLPQERRHVNAYIFTPDKIYNRAGLIHTDRQVPIVRYCGRPFSQLCVTYKGKAILCCNDYFGQIEIGDIATQSLQEIWSSKLLMHYRKELLQGNRAGLALCKLCDR